MRAATYAKRIGRAVAFSLAAFRQTFAAGRDLGEEETVLIAGAACELHPSALLKGVAMRSVADALDAAIDRARAAGIGSLPAIQVDGRVFEGETAIERAAECGERVPRFRRQMDAIERLLQGLGGGHGGIECFSLTGRAQPLRHRADLRQR